MKRRNGKPIKGPNSGTIAGGGNSGVEGNRIEKLFSNMRGLLTLAPGYKPEEPLDEEWRESFLGHEERK